ncbi:MAG: hypothetical protein L0H84_17940 [Pseudonocardia sp.]|nr:hypothetical protein [Pseudonocardia sp.]
MSACAPWRRAREMVMSIPPSQGAAVPCPVASTATPIPSSRASRRTTTAATSAVSSAITTAAGRWHAVRFQAARAPS